MPKNHDVNVILRRLPPCFRFHHRRRQHPPAADRGQQDFYYVVRARLDFDYDTLESILTAAWESHEETRDFEKGEEHHVPPVKGADWARDRSLKPAPDPFTQREV